MKMRNCGRLLFYFLSLALLSAGCVAGEPHLLVDRLDGGGDYYTASNIWHERPDILSTNYKRGTMIPVGTKVSSLKLMQGRTTYISFTVKKTGQTYRIHLIPKHNPGLTGEAMLSRLFARKTVKQLTKGFTEKEMKAVQFGQVMNTMSKAAVLVSRGYPPEIRTPSIEADKWIYWDSKFDKKELTFNMQGRVEHIRD